MGSASPKDLHLDGFLPSVWGLQNGFIKEQSAHVISSVCRELTEMALCILGSGFIIYFVNKPLLSLGVLLTWGEISMLISLPTQ